MTLITCNILFVKILNYIVYSEYNYNKKISVVEFLNIVTKLSLVSKVWKSKIVPSLSYPALSLSQKSNLNLLRFIDKNPTFSFSTYIHKGFISKEHIPYLGRLLENVKFLEISSSPWPLPEQEFILQKQLEALKYAKKLAIFIEEKILTEYLQSHSPNIHQHVEQLELYVSDMANLVKIMDMYQCSKLTYKKFSDEYYNQLEKLNDISTLKKLTFLMDQNSLNYKNDIKQIAEFILQNRSLTSLKLDIYGNDYCIDPILKALAKNQTIKEFRVVGYVGYSLIKYSNDVLVEALNQNTGIQTLHLDAPSEVIPSKSGDKIINSTLKYFQINNNHEKRSKNSLLQLFENNTSIRTLRFTRFLDTMVDDLGSKFKMVNQLVLHSRDRDTPPQYFLDKLVISFPNLLSFRMITDDNDNEDDGDDGDEEDYEDDDDDEGDYEDDDDDDEDEDDDDDDDDEDDEDENDEDD
ncbi:G-protein-coupled receptor [Tieghemostelium lacteum]|uniref:G-protein-coupled receptor n=1 Tax=Tieghemostelium lacteum TaxID=361077 RepID=A0A152A7N1_TIELA|nr:G-protein-coupled receptor [Tieghemostelium lacteum]|eukprot:KYR02253.1 G-protein-coupled receptor [Tieghemostelium lacteum]